MVAAAAVLALLVITLPSDTEQSARPISACVPPYRPPATEAGCRRPYSPASPFNAEVGSSPAIDTDSPRVIDRITGRGPIQSPVLGVADTESDFGHPVYYASSSDPVYEVHCVRWTEACEIEGSKIRIPEAARPAGGSDGHMAVIDEEGAWEYDFWQARPLPAGGGIIEISQGGRTRLDGDGLGSNATAAHFGLLAGLIRPQELRSGRIDHALFLTARCTNGEAVPPAAAGTSGDSCATFGEPNQAAPPMGAHLWLDLGPAELAELGLPRWKRAILLALHRYGGYIGDTMNGHSSIGIMLESGSSYTSFGEPDPWLALARRSGARGSADGGFPLDLDAGLDWRHHLHLLSP